MGQSWGDCGGRVGPGDCLPIFARTWIGQGCKGHGGTSYVVRYKRQEAAGKLEQTHVRRYEVLGVIS